MILGMDLWYPPKDAPHLFEWWRPVVLAARNARLDRFPWPLHIDDVMLMGRVDRGSRPDIWVYKHIESRGEIYLDATGQAYKFTHTPNAKGYGRFTPIDIRAALWRASLPTVVEPIWYEDPGPGRASSWGYDDDEPEVDDPEPAPPPRRRGHLTVLEGGQSLAG